MSAANGQSAEHKDALPPIDGMGFWKFLPLFGATLLVPRAICGAVAVAIYKNGNTALYERNITSLTSQQGYLYAAAALFGLLVSWLNNYPVLYKHMVMRLTSGNLRANMLIYKLAVATGAEEPSYVVLETDGPVGSYNRANRSLHHFGENALPMALSMLLAGCVFPLPTFVATACFAVGRVLHQVGYAAVGYGGHAPGFFLSMLASTTLEMLCLLVAVKSLELPTPAATLLRKLEL
mmetsp:Transcript_77318/g.213802  ORF Transcript_77318/g.213802 Transcript_77318/m.213802 type:complete len:236 (-) Transcript_77318:105-812(-)